MKRGVEVDSDRFGGDYRWFATGIMQPEGCQATCAQQAECKPGPIAR